MFFNSFLGVDNMMLMIDAKSLQPLESFINSKCPSDESSTVDHVECIRIKRGTVCHVKICTVTIINYISLFYVYYCLLCVYSIILTRWFQPI